MAYRAIYYDTETTGIRSDKDRIIEIAAYDPERDTSFVQLVNPGCSIPAEATAIHHITDEMVANERGFAEVGQAFIDFCDGDVVLIAHNNEAFDKLFLQAECQRNQLTLPLEWRYFDTLKWARRYRKDLPRHTLQFLREVYGIAANTAHRALDDVIILHKVFSALLDDLTIDDAYRLLEVPKEIHSMPFGKHQGTPLAQMPAHYVKWLADSGALDKPENAQLKASFIQLGLLKAA
jgi:DNA polymerase-3 subunit epsilon